MSLLGDVRTILDNHPELWVVGIDERHVFGSFNTHVFRVAPKAELNDSELATLFYLLRSCIPQETHDVKDMFIGITHSGRLIYRETIGKERVLRTFTVDDASAHWGEEFTSGAQVPEEHELVRDIEVRLYPDPREAHLHKSGRTIYEKPVMVAA